MNTFRLPDMAALDAMLKRSNVRVVRPMEPRKQEEPVAVKTVKLITERKREKPDYVGVLVRQIEREGITGFVREHPFAKEIGRKWRIDIAFVDRKIAIEVDGMAHRTKDRFMRDIEKHNQLMLHGWRLLRVYTRWIATERVELSMGIDLVKQALEAA